MSPFTHDTQCASGLVQRRRRLVVVRRKWIITYLGHVSSATDVRRCVSSTLKPENVGGRAPMGGASEKARPMGFRIDGGVVVAPPIRDKSQSSEMKSQSGFRYFPVRREILPSQLSGLRTCCKLVELVRLNPHRLFILRSSRSERDHLELFSLFKNGADADDD